MPKGIKGSGKAAKKEAKPEVAVEKPKEEIKETPKTVTGCRPPHLTKCQCQDKLGTGQAFFEDGETGTHIIGEDTKNEIWFREGNKGKGSWANRKR